MPLRHPDRVQPGQRRDSVAHARHQTDDCIQSEPDSAHGEPAVLADSESFAARARKLVTRGFKPKDAAEITLQEIIFENRNDPVAVKKARTEAEDFLRRVKDGII